MLAAFNADRRTMQFTDGRLSMVAVRQSGRLTKVAARQWRPWSMLVAVNMVATL